MDTAEHIDRFAEVAGRFSTRLTELAASEPDRLATTVVTCPDWTIRQLVEHVGGIYHWVTEMVAGGVVVETWRKDFPIRYPEDDASVAPWFAAALDPLVAAVRAARPDAPAWVWGTDPHARFWARRMLHETTVHLTDLLLTLGERPDVDPTVAVDGVDEHLTNLPATARWGAPLDVLRGSGETMVLRATDTPNTWCLRFAPTGCWWDRGDEASPDVSVVGPAHELCLFVQGRRAAEVEIVGDGELVTRWFEAAEF